MARAPPWRQLDRRRRKWIEGFAFAVGTVMGFQYVQALEAGVSAAAMRTAINISSPSSSANVSSATSTTAIDPLRLHPRVTTYRNGYGTHFECNSTCYFTMIAYMVSIATLLALLAVIPVHSPSKAEHAPFLLWFGNNQPGQGDGKHLEPHEYGFFDRLSVWLYGPKNYKKLEEDPPPEVESDHESSVDVVTEETEPVKTFESIGVETDDSLLPTLYVKPLDDCVVVEDVDKLFDFVPQPSPSRKPGIFSPATPKVPATRADFGSSDPNLLSDARPNERRGSVSPRRPLGSPTGSGRRGSVIGATPSESLLVAVERRNSMQKRAEKRKEYAKSDIAHDNLHEHEFHMYEYLEFIRELLEGTTIKKVCQKSAKVVKRTFFITPDLSVVYWNKLGNKGWTSKKSSLETTAIDKVIKGIHGNANLQSKGKQEKQEKYLSVMLKGGKQLDLEADDEKIRDRMFLGFTRLASEKRDELEKKRLAKEETDRFDAQLGAPQEARQTQEEIKALPQHEAEEARRSADERRAKSEEDDPEQWRKTQLDPVTTDTNQAEEETKGEDGDV